VRPLCRCRALSGERRSPGQSKSKKNENFGHIGSSFYLGGEKGEISKPSERLLKIGVADKQIGGPRLGEIGEIQGGD